ncbi:TolC family protein [Brevundimonas sp.]|uniref:TolC family protein n=1 Tax=Brevundimonas sp. TaxID=1871086 RepID=UPI0037C137AB
MILAGSPAWAGASLEEAVLRGVLRHPEVRGAEAEVAMAATEAQIARNGYLPTFGASTGPAAAGVGYDLTLSQTVYDFGQTGSQIDQKRALLAQQQANLEVVRDDVALEIVEVYLDIASKRAQLSVVETHLEHLTALAEMARTRVESRYSDQAETGRVALAVATAQGNQARLTGELADATDHYALLVDEAPNGVRLPDPPRFLDRVREEGDLEAAIATSPLYRRAALAVRAADAGIREAKAARFPRVAVEGSLQRREIGGRLVDDSAVALRLRFNSQQGLAALQRPELEEQRRAAIALGAESVARDLRRIVESLAAQDGALDGRIGALSDQAEQSGAVRDVYREQFLVGRRDIQDLVIMETENFEAERQVIELTIDRLRLQYRAAAQLGLLIPAMSGDDMQSPTEIGR